MGKKVDSKQLWAWKEAEYKHILVALVTMKEVEYNDFLVAFSEDGIKVARSYENEKKAEYKHILVTLVTMKEVEYNDFLDAFSEDGKG